MSITARPKTLALAALAATALALSGGGTPSTAASTAKIRLGQLTSYNTLDISKNLSLAKALPNGASVEWTTGLAAFAPALDAANSGNIDGGSGGFTNFFTALASGAQIVVIGAEDNSEAEGIVATAASGIQTIQDLKGHHIAVNKGGTGEYLAKLAISKAGLQPGDVTLDYLAPADAIAAFQSGAVDAIAIWDQYYATAQLEPGARVVATATSIGNLNQVFFWVTKQFADAHPQEVQSLIAGLKDTSAQVAVKPSLVTDFYTELGAGSDVTGLIAKWQPYKFEPVNDKVIAKFTQLGQQLVRFGIIQSVPDISNSFVKQK